MKADWIRKAAALPARQLHLLGVGVLLIAAAALWFYGLRAPLAALHAVRAEQEQLAFGGSDPHLLAAQLGVLDADTQALVKRLGAGPGQPSAQLMVNLMGKLGTLAREQGVTLHGVAPLPEETALVFTRIAFNLEVTGSYASLLAWMGAVERSQPNLSIASFEMRPADAPGQVAMKIRIAAYQPQESKP